MQQTNARVKRARRRAYIKRKKTSLKETLARSGKKAKK
jgi:hypothetical protein